MSEIREAPDLFSNRFEIEERKIHIEQSTSGQEYMNKMGINVDQVQQLFQKSIRAAGRKFNVLEGDIPISKLRIVTRKEYEAECELEKIKEHPITSIKEKILDRIAKNNIRKPSNIHGLLVYTRSNSQITMLADNFFNLLKPFKEEDDDTYFLKKLQSSISHEVGHAAAEIYLPLKWALPKSNTKINTSAVKFLIEVPALAFQADFDNGVDFLKEQIEKDNSNAVILVKDLLLNLNYFNTISGQYSSLYNEQNQLFFNWMLNKFGPKRLANLQQPIKHLTIDSAFQTQFGKNLKQMVDEFAVTMLSAEDFDKSKWIALVEGDALTKKNKLDLSKIIVGSLSKRFLSGSSMETPINKSISSTSVFNYVKTLEGLYYIVLNPDLKKVQVYKKTIVDDKKVYVEDGEYNSLLEFLNDKPES